MKITRFAVALLPLLIGGGVKADGLNDTGIRPDQYSWDQNDQLYPNDFGNGIVTIQLNNNYPRQDPQFGRDPAAASGALVKIGGGAAGFDFTRLCGNGDEEGQGSCPSGLTSANIGSGAGQWACTRDNLTGRTWEVKSDNGGLQDKDWQYTWYNTDTGTNGGNAGTQTPSVNNPTVCGSHLTNCNTEEYRAAVNALNAAAGLCGHTDWRMPSKHELQSIFDYGHTPPPLMIETDYFPNTVFNNHNYIYWTGSTTAQDSANAWRVAFDFGYELLSGKFSVNYVRLVRSDQ